MEGSGEGPSEMSPWSPGKYVAGGGYSRSSQGTRASLPWAQALLLLSVSIFYDKKTEVGRFSDLPKIQS